MAALLSKTGARGRLAGLAVPAAIGIAAAALELGGAGARQALRYDRAALADGELWRLLTGHLVHLGPSHMLMNVAALAVLAFVLSPLLRARDWLLGAGLAALAIDAGLYGFHPAVGWYVGLSGVLHGLWATAAVKALSTGRIEALPLALLLVAKLGYELLVGPVPFTGEIAAGPVVTAAHAWGALGGSLAALIGVAITRGRASI